MPERRHVIVTARWITDRDPHHPRPYRQVDDVWSWRLDARSLTPHPSQVGKRILAPDSDLGRSITAAQTAAQAANWRWATWTWSDTLGA